MENKQIKFGVILSYLTLVISILTSLVYMPFLTRYLGTSEYGVYMLIGSLMGYFILFDFGLGNALKRYIAKYRNSDKEILIGKVISMSMLIYFFIALVSLVIGIIVYLNLESLIGNKLTLFEIELAKSLTIILVIDTFFAFIFMVFSSIIEGYEQFIFIRVVKILRNLIFPIVLIPLLIMGFQSLMVVILNLVLNLIVGFSNMIYVKRSLKIKIRYFLFDIKILKEIYSYAFFVFLAVIVDLILWKTGQVIVGIEMGSNEVAIYAIAMQLSVYYISIGTVIPAILFPKITRELHSENHKVELLPLFIKTGRIQYFILGLVAILLVLYGREFIEIWVGKDYANAHEILLVILLPLTYHLLQNIGVAVLQAKNWHKFRVISLILMAIVNIPLSIYLVKHLGSIGSAFGISLTIFVGDILIMNIYYHYKLKVNMLVFFKEIIKLSPLIIIVFSISYYSKSYINMNLLGLVLSIIFTIVIYLILLYQFVLNKEEKKEVNQIFNRTIK